MPSRFSSLCRAASLVCLLAFGWLGQSHAAGFDERYEVRVGNSDNDGVADDLYIRQKPQIILVDLGDVATPVVVPGDVKEFLLQYSGSAFTIRSNLSAAERSQYAGWPIANVETTLSDLNADDRNDLVIKGISALPNLGTALDQMVFADPIAHRAPPVHVKGIDENVRRFFRDLAGQSRNPNYYFQTAIQNNWYHVNEGPLIVDYWSIAYLRWWGVTWNNGAIRAADSSVADIFNPNTRPALCGYFNCRWSTDRWFAYVQARQLDLIVHYENFSQPARSVEGALGSMINSGSVTCGSANANALANAAQGVLGIQVWGGALSSCTRLEREVVFSSAEIAGARLAWLFKWLKSATPAVQPASDRGSPTANQADLAAALAYLNQSATFRALWAEFQKLPVKIIVHRNAPEGHVFAAGRPKEVIWDPDRGLVMEGGVGSAAAGLAHEIAHAVQYYALGHDAYIEADKWTTISTTDPNDPTHLIQLGQPSAEEERATDVEAAIQAELGEPQRQRYNDGLNRNFVVPSPTFSCSRGNQACDTMIGN